jgi:hypothetical protein
MGASRGREIEMKVGRQTLIKLNSEPIIFNANFSIAQTSPNKRTARRVSVSEPDLFDVAADIETASSEERSNDKNKQNVVVRNGKQSKIKVAAVTPRRAKPQISGKQNGKKTRQASVSTNRK